METILFLLFMFAAVIFVAPHAFFPEEFFIKIKDWIDKINDKFKHWRVG